MPQRGDLVSHSIDGRRGRVFSASPTSAWIVVEVDNTLEDWLACEVA